jgi:hypothetical protein
MRYVKCPKLITLVSKHKPKFSLRLKSAIKFYNIKSIVLSSRRKCRIDNNKPMLLKLIIMCRYIKIAFNKS